MTTAARTQAAERMRGPGNPMRSRAARRRVSIALAGRGPSVRWGTGRLSVPQRMLARELGWRTEVTICTGWGRAYPRSYVADIASEALKIAIEVDGRSHRSIAMRARDRRRDRRLEALGWVVIRLRNEDVLGDLGACVEAVGTYVEAREEAVVSA